MSDCPFVSATSANAIISELRPTILSGPALGHVNAILDEVLVSIIEASASLNPADLRTKGFPAVFAEAASEQHASVGSLGRAAIGEAEVEIRSWYEAHPSARDGFRGFPPRGNGRGLTEEAERRKKEFPVAEAVELMRLKTSSFSTFAPEPAPPQHDVDSTFALWQQAGGDIGEETVSPAALWLTAVLEHICEHILSKLTQVLGRDCVSTTADTADLYTAICEDDSMYAIFTRMKVRTKLEQEARGMAGPKRPFRSTSGPSPTVEPAVSPDGSFASLPASNRDDYRLHKKYGSTGASSANRPGSDQFARVPLATNSKPPPVPASGQHKRASSVLSLSARQIIGAWQQGQDETDKSSKRLSVGQAEDDFDALIRSGETMRVSLTPSRLSTFDPSFISTNRRDKRNSAATSDYISAQQSSSESSLLSSNSTQASTAESGMVTGGAQRVAAGRSLSAATAKAGTVRRSTIEENEEEGTSTQPEMETLKAEPEVYGSTSPAIGSSSASGSGSGSGGTQVDTPTPRGSLLRLPATAVASEPTNSPHSSPGAVHDSPRAASEGADENNGTQTVRLRAKPASVRDRGNTGDLADFLKNTAPVEYIKGTSPPEPAAEASSSTALPQVQVNDEPVVNNGPIENIAVKKKGPRFKAIMSRMSVQKKDKKDDDPGIKAWAEKTLVPSPSNQTLKSHGMNGSDKSQLRSKKSSSSFASASTLMPPALSPAASIDSGGSTPLTTREVLRKPSLVRKWAAQVTAGEPNRRRSRSPLMPNSPMLGSEQQHGDNEELGDTLTEEPASMEASEVGLGLGSPAIIHSRVANGHISTIEESDYYEDSLGAAGTRDTIETSATLDTMATIDTVDCGPQGPEQALAVLTAASKTNSPVTTPSTPDERFQASALPSKSSKSKSIASGRSSLVFSSSVQYADNDDGEEERAAAASTPGATSATESPSIDSVTPVSALPSRVSHKKARSRHSSYASLSRRPEPVEHGKNFVDVADLVPLRQLLDHATTARECQLLLDAILSQLGVPRGEILGGTVARPDDRVVAWLLSGREGPVGDITPVHPKSHSRASSYAGGHGRTSSKHMPSSRSASSLSGRRRIAPEAANKNLPALPPPSPLGEEAPPLTPIVTAPVTPEPAPVTRTPVVSPPSRKKPIAIEIGATAGEIDSARKADARRARRASAPLMSPSPDLGLTSSPKLSSGLEVPSPRV